MSGAWSQAVWVAAAAAGLEVVTGAGLVIVPSLLARLLFGSEMNAAGDLVTVRNPDLHQRKAAYLG
jgi:hypothetical protein